MASFDLFDPEQTLRGVSTHFKTPFLENGRLDEASFERAARHAVDVGSCLAITGQRGCETLDLSEAERYRSLEISIETCRGRTPVLATAAAATVADTVETAKRMDDMGADMISALAPASTHGGGHIVTCLRAVAEAVSVPIMLRTFDWGHHLNMEQSAQLAREVPNVRYMKQEGLYPTREVAELMGLPGGDLYMGVIVGPPYVPNYLAGARILTAALDVTEPLVAIFDAMEAGDLDRARAISARRRFAAVLQGLFPRPDRQQDDHAAARADRLAPGRDGVLAGAQGPDAGRGGRADGAAGAADAVLREVPTQPAGVTG